MTREKYTPLSNKEAIEYLYLSPNLTKVSYRIIIVGLKDLLKQREENFRDHTQKCKKKTIVALQRIFHPFTILTLIYTAFMIYNTEVLYNDYQAKKDSPSLSHRIHLINRTSVIVQHIITIVVVLLLVVIDVYLRIQRLNYRVFNIDSKIQQVIDKFDQSNKSIFNSDLCNPLLAEDDNWINKLYG